MMMASSFPSHRPGESTHHRLLDFVKSVLINVFVFPYATVCDMYCGQVPDVEKWDEAQIGHYIGIDVATSGVNEVKEAWETQRKAYTYEFIELDPCIEDIDLHWKDKEKRADIVFCMHNLQVCFDSEEKARRLLHNVSSLLKPGGYFLGITPDSSTIWLAREAGLEHTEIQNLTDFYDDNRAQFLGMLQDAGHNFIDPRGRLLPRSYDVLGLFTTFIFQKPDPDIAPPLTTPFLPVGSHYLDEMEWQVILWDEEEKNGQTDSSVGLGKITEQKGILGPGPAELRFPEAI